MMDEFVKWEAGIKDEIAHVSSLLSEQLSDEPEKLVHDLEAVEVWNARCQALLAQANNWLDRGKYYLMPPRGEGKMEGDRKAEVDNAVAPIRLVRDTLESFCESIKQRLILGASILAYHRSFIEHRGVGEAPVKKSLGDILRKSA